MTSRTVRAASIALLTATLSLPLAAQPGPALPSPASLLGEIWTRLTAPLAALFAPSDTDGRSGWDPDGLSATSETDGRSGWDPNG